MSALAAHAESPAAGKAALHLFAVFHCNLAFSSIEERERAAVIERCYWPMLRLARDFGPVGIEATGFTLEDIEARDPSWIAELRRLIATGKVELIGSGYAQIIGPLVPADVTRANLRIGHRIYERLLGSRPTLALINEQAYSGGLVGLYLDAGYDAILMDWDNPSSHHPEWDAELRYAPQRALGADGRDIGLLWTNTVAFQKLQRFAHGDISRDDLLSFVADRQGTRPRALCVYASDAEIFNYRPGRYKTEEKLSDAEWPRMNEAFGALAHMPGMRMVTPSAAMQAIAPNEEPLRLETAAYPVPVKKQRKYNLTRWAVTGRDDIAINAACQRIFAKLQATKAGDDDWKELCRLWSSDFRTHITDARWTRFCADLAAMERRLGCAKAALPVGGGLGIGDRFIEIATPSVKTRLDRRRGLAIQSLGFAPDFTPVVGGLPHGFFDDIALQADWYTGDCVFESPGEAKVTDLEWAETDLREDNSDIVVRGWIDTPLGRIEKHMRFCAREPRVDFDIRFHWSEWGKGSLRLGHVTLLPDAFDADRLSLATTNGGEREIFPLAGQTVDHGAPVSFLVSASCGLGMTEGWAELSDGRRGVRVEVDRETAPLLGLLTHRKAGGSLFCQLVLTALELDDTRKPAAYGAEPRRVRFCLRSLAKSY